MIIAKLAALSALATGQTTDVAPGTLSYASQGATVFCPLERTTVNAEVSGFGAEVTVVQKFTNTSDTPIEAVYTFPMPSSAAVGRMRIKVGDRLVEGVIKRREEARLIYEAAKQAGQTTALLDQERPNIFTQSVANITPGATVEVEITYVELLKFRDGEFEFSFPMTVGPRFLGNAPDPAKIDPPRAKRVGTDIDLTVHLRNGVPAKGIRSVLHEITQTPMGGSGTTVKLRKQDELPNRDFILRYSLSGDAIETSFMTHTDKRGGFFTMVVLPPKEVAPTQVGPREVIFVVDQSGSQQGFPIEKSKELTLQMLKTMRRGDTFNVLGFNNNVKKLWDKPRPFNEANFQEARNFVTAMQANGGTQLRDGVLAALAGTPPIGFVRIVLFNTDGFIGDESAVLQTIKERRETARMFTFGIGNSVNRFLIDAMAEEGRGEAEVVTLAEGAEAAVARFAKRMQSPVLTDVSMKFTGATVTGIQPVALPDVFADKPIVVFGRFQGSGPGSVEIRGNAGGKPWVKRIAVDFAARTAPAIPVLWARKRVSEIERGDYMAGQASETYRPSVEAITKIGLDFGIMTSYTSFVAVEKRVVNIGGKQRTVAVPVEQADGVTFGQGDGLYRGAPPATRANRMVTGGAGGLGGGGLGGGGFGGPGTGGTTATTGAGGASAALPRARTLEAIPGGDAQRQMLSSMSPEDRQKNKKLFIDTKVHRSVRESKEKSLEVQILVDKLDDKTLALLKKHGVKVEDQDAKLKVVFATIETAKLGDLAILDEVHSINPL